ncbi:Cytidylyltransferase [Candidatus Hepatincola sp. Av]
MKFKEELQRKLIHLSSTVYPLIYYFVDKSVTMVIVVTIFHVVLFWDLLRRKGFSLPKLSFINIFLRIEEQNCQKLCGATYFMMAVVMVIAIFPKDIAILSMLILIYSDTTAALVGKFGKIKIKSLNKTLEGFIAYIIIGIIIIVGYYKFFATGNINFENYLIAFVALFISGLCELFAKKLFFDDNLLVTLSYAVTSYLGNYFLLLL